ncbi:protein kinase [uncultured Nocardioides sp.]|uniref:serine/threonine-protein kinase n=1 Tax=uncultured Nocardioides sp. TaxID=198441 RepID=UPI00262B614E|nr:protein kinase [uncultured Nocardioides sp.]
MSTDPGTTGRLLARRYRLDDLVGHGGMGVVHRATDLRLDRRVAVKVISGARSGAEEARARFAREVAALARLDSPHVVAIVDHGEADGGDADGGARPGSPYLVTQLVPGGDLGSVLRGSGGLAPATAVEVVAQVLDALRDAHAAGVVHRDVKPANVLLRDADAVREDRPGDVHVYLCDFGIAQLAADDGLTSTGMVAGTWAYLPPERGRGEAATAASDLYAAGCLLWACLTGRPPYDGSDVEVAIAHQHEPVPRLGWTGDLGTALDAVLTRAMAKDPADRYADAAAMRADLLALPLTGSEQRTAGAPAAAAARTADHTTPRHPAAPAGDGRRPDRPRRALLGAGLALLLLGGAGAAVAWWPDGGTTGRAGDAPAPDPAAEVTGDVDGDGLGDLALSSVTTTGTATGTGFTTWSGTGDGLDDPVERSGIDTRNVPVLGDFDGDGRPEYVGITSTTSGALVLQPVGGGTPSWVVAGAGFEVPPVVADLDGDGTDDLALLGYPGGGGFDAEGQTGGEVRVALGGDEARTAEGRLGGDLNPVTDLLVPADLDGDADDDLLLVRPQGLRGGTPGAVTVTAVLADDGALTMGPESAELLDVAGTKIVRAADVDGDGTDEVAIVPSTGGREVRLLALGADGTVTKTDPWGTTGGSTATASVRSVGVLDVDGDSRDDLALVRADPDGGAVTGVEVLRTGEDGVLEDATPLLDLTGQGVLTAKVADGSVNRPFGVDS